MSEIKNIDKDWYKSRTLWINILIFSVGVLTIVQGELEAGGAITVAGIANIVLRAATKSGLRIL